jgi:hypothetical protein
MKKILENVWAGITKDPKTTITGLIGFGVFICMKFGYHVGHDTIENVIAGSLLILGLLSGGTTKEPNGQ